MYNFDFEENEKWRKILELTYAVWKVSDVSLEDKILKNKIKDISNNIFISYTNYISEEECGKEREIVCAIDSLLALLSLAQKISKLKEINFLILKNEYKKIKFTLLVKIESRELNSFKVDLKERDLNQEVKDEKKVFKTKLVEKKIAENNYKKNKENIQKSEIKISELTSREKLKSKPVQKKENLKYVNKNLSQREDMLLNFFKARKNQELRLKDLKKLFPKITDRTIRNDLKSLCDKNFIQRSQSRGQGSFYFLVK